MPNLFVFFVGCCIFLLIMLIFVIFYFYPKNFCVKCLVYLYVYRNGRLLFALCLRRCSLLLLLRVSLCSFVLLRCYYFAGKFNLIYHLLFTLLFLFDKELLALGSIRTTFLFVPSDLPEKLHDPPINILLYLWIILFYFLNKMLNFVTFFIKYVYL